MLKTKKIIFRFIYLFNHRLSNFVRLGSGDRFIKIFLSLVTGILIYGCSSIETQAQYAEVAPRANSDLTVPPGLSKPALNPGYKIMGSSASDTQQSYQLNQIKNMTITEAGSQRWLVVSNKSVNQVWPTMLAYLNQMGLVVKYQNQNVGLIQTDWANHLNNVPQTGIRELFSLIGWDSMYSLPSKYIFRINLWQNESNTQIFVTDYQMNEVYSLGDQPHYSSVEPSDNERTKWMAIPPNPQLELDFLLNFMAFSGLDQTQVQQIKTKLTTESQTKQARLNGNQLLIYDQFDRAWWRTALALERAGLGVADKDRSQGVYYVYQLQSQVIAPDDPSFIAKWFGAKPANTLSLPKPSYTVKLTEQGQQTILTMELYPGTTEKDFVKNQQKYLALLFDQLK